MTLTTMCFFFPYIDFEAIKRWQAKVETERKVEAIRLQTERDRAALNIRIADCIAREQRHERIRATLPAEPYTKEQLLNTPYVGTSAERARDKDDCLALAAHFLEQNSPFSPMMTSTEINPPAPAVPTPSYPMLLRGLPNSRGESVVILASSSPSAAR